MAKSCDPIKANIEGLEYFAAGDPISADKHLRQAYKNLSEETGILVNLGLALMQQGQVDKAEKAYRLALQSDELRVRRSASKILGSYCSGEVSMNKAGNTIENDLKEKVSKPTCGGVIHSTVRHSLFGTM